jgi:Putative beta-barrel porin-2, OmpL-like. bbp2
MRICSQLLSIALLFLLFSGKSCGQSSSGAKPEDEMAGRDDSSSDRRPFAGGTYPEDLKPLLPNYFPIASWAARHRVTSFGWLDGGISSITGASGLVTEAPTPERFSNQLVLNAAWLTVERKTNDESFSWGFRTDFYAGSDAALLRSLNHVGPLGTRWGTDFRQAYFSLHTPILFKRGIDWTAGRINFPTGAETVMGAYQQLYSRGYFWLHGGTSGTALLATIHVDPQLDIVGGTTMGYGTTFILRGRAPDYLVRILYHPATQRKQQFIATVYTGPKPLSAVSGHVGSWQTLAELQVREVWTSRFTQIYQASYLADSNDPGNGRRNSASQGAFILNSYALSSSAAMHLRLEWFSDPHGARILIPGTYSEAAAGVSFYPKPWFEFRPEIRGDFSGQQSFGSFDSTIHHRNQLSVGFEFIFKGHFIGLQNSL